MTAPPAPIRVHIVDDEHIVQDHFARCLAAQPGILVTGTSSSATEAVAALATAPAHVVLMDIQMPLMDGFGATHAIRERYPRTQVLLITHLDDDDAHRRTILAGAVGVLTKATDPSEIAEVIRVAQRGHRVITRVDGTLDDVTGTRRLTTRERDTLALIGDGDTNAAIAATLLVSFSTVKSTVGRLLNLYGVPTRGQLAQQAMLMGLDATAVRERHARPTRSP